MSKQVLTQSRSLWLHLLLTPFISHNREWSSLCDMEISSQVHKLHLNASIAWKVGRSHWSPFPCQRWDLQILTMISVLWAGLTLQVLWFNTSQWWSLTQTLAHPQPCSGMGKRIIRAKITSKSDSWVEIMGQKRKKIITMMVIIMTKELDIQNCSPLDQSPAGSWPVASIQLSPQFMYWAWPHMIWIIFLVGWGHLFWPCPLPFSCAPPLFSWKVLDSG